MNRYYSICVGLLISIAAMPCRALMEPLSTEELVLAADTVIVGTVVEKRAAWASGGSKIVTTYQILITEMVAGYMPGKVVEVEHDGGVVGEIGLEVSDVAEMKMGDNVLLFLSPVKSQAAAPASRLSKRTGDSICRVVGQAQGRYFISADGVAAKSGYDVVGSSKKIDGQLSRDALVTKIRALWAKKPISPP